MRKIAVDQLQRLRRASTDDDVIVSDVTSAGQVGDNRRCAEAGDDNNQLRATPTSEPSQ